MNNSQTTHNDDYNLLIAGKSVQSTDGQTREVVDPATGEPVATVALASEHDIDLAVESGLEAAREWSVRPGRERGRILNQLADLIREEVGDLARLLTLENGKPLDQARSEVEIGAKYFEYYAGAADKIQGETIPLTEEYTDYTVREPLGVTAHITPWNFPVDLLGRTVAPALAAGNVSIVKPAEQTPLTAVEVGHLALEAGVPPGVLNVIPGLGPEAGAALANHRDIGGVSFTGSVAAGREVAKLAVENLTQVHVEAGGKNAAIVFPDADLNCAVENVITGIFTTNAGQVCSAADRVLVHEDAHDELVRRLENRAEELTIGPGVEEEDIGAIVSGEQYNCIREFIQQGREENGDPLLGGTVPEGTGYFVPPTIFDDVDPDSTLAQEEIFGPVLVVSTFADETEAVEIANDVQYGLVAGVFTENLGRAHRIARDLDVGQVYVNEWFAGGVQTPFGGYKMSGFGREKGLEAIEEFTQVKNVCINIDY